MDSRCLGDVERVTVESGLVLRHIFATGRRPYRFTDAQFLQAGPEWVSVQPLTTGAQSMACVYGYARPACRRGDIDYYKMNIEYEKIKFPT